MSPRRPLRPGTLCVRGGRDRRTDGGLALPIYPGTVGVFPSFEESVETFEGHRKGFIYARYGHRTGQEVEALLASLQGTESALLCSSGMSAIALTILSCCRSGDHLIASPEHYGGVTELLQGIISGLGIEVTYVPLEELGALGPRVRENTRLILVETPTNPLLRLVDLRALMAGLNDPGPPVAVDATLATPVGMDTTDIGCDLVLHSATKYLGGHDDLTAGVVAGPESLIAPVREQRRIIGAMCEPQTAWLLERGIKTLDVRWERQCSTAGRLAEQLENHDAVERVHYPGLPSHIHHELARRQMSRFGAMLAFEVKSGMEGATRVFDRLELIARSPTLGGVESMLLHPATSSHRQLSLADREAMGITDGLLRVSVGLEDPRDLWDDLAQALG